MRQHLAHDIRQRLMGKLIDLYPARTCRGPGRRRHLRHKNCDLKREMGEHVVHDTV